MSRLPIIFQVRDELGGRVTLVTESGHACSLSMSALRQPVSGAVTLDDFLAESVIASDRDAFARAIVNDIIKAPSPSETGGKSSS